MSRFAAFALGMVLVSTASANGIFGNFMNIIPEDVKKRGEKMTGDTNEALKGVNEATGMDHPLPENDGGVLGLFWTPSPSPSSTPTPSITPTSSVTPTISPSGSPSASVTPTSSTSPAVTVTPTPSKSPSPTPFREGFDKRAPSIVIDEVVENVSDDLNNPTEVSIDLSEQAVPISSGDTVVIDEIQVQADLDPALFDPSALPSDGEETTSRFIIPGLVRQGGNTAAQRCGVYLIFSNGEERQVKIASLNAGIGCLLQKIEFEPIEWAVDEDGNALTWTMAVLCNKKTCKARTSIRVKINPGNNKQSPAPLPSN